MVRQAADKAAREVRARAAPALILGNRPGEK